MELYEHHLLFIQKVYQIAIYKIVGMLIFKPQESYRGNISIKGNVMKVTYTKKKIQKMDKKNKNDDNFLFSNGFINSEFDLTESVSTSHMDKSEENNNSNKIKNENEIKKKNKIEEFFDNIREDDENYYKFKDYKEVNKQNW